MVLFQSNSYRNFLRAAFQSEKGLKGAATLTSFAAKFGLAPSTFQMILKGQRNLTVENLHAVARALKMSFSEREYFEALVLWEQSSDPESRSYYQRRLKRLKKSAPLQTVRVGSRNLLSDPAAPALLMYLLDFEKVDAADFRLDQLPLSRIAQDLGVPLPRIQALLRELVATGLLRKYPGKPLHFVFEKISSQFSQKNYLLNEIEVLRQQVKTRFADPSTMFRAFTLTLSREDLPALRIDLVSLLETYMAKTPPAREEGVIEKVVIGAYPLSYKTVL